MMLEVRRKKWGAPEGKGRQICGSFAGGERYNRTHMVVSGENESARVTLSREGDVLVATVSGAWRITGERPEWAEVVRKEAVPAGGVRMESAGLRHWDSSLAVFLHGIREWCRAKGVECDCAVLPEAVCELASKLQEERAGPPRAERSEDFVTRIGLETQDAWTKTRDIVHFVGECVLSGIFLLKNPQRFRWGDCVQEMLKCGAMALPIVSLINGLVGLTLGYTGAVILRQFGADIWVADLVGLSMVREMGPVMTAIVLAGRTGAAFAAQLGNMKGNEEIDALETLGIRPVDFLVMPRIVALGLMMPLLALYGNALGIFGGMLVARTLSIPATAYWVEMQTIVDLSDILSGLIKACTFGVLVGLAGCLRGLQADRSAAGVGQAATSAVVTGILLIITWDAIYAVIFNMLGI